jgi:hypothetical protein
MRNPHFDDAMRSDLAQILPLHHHLSGFRADYLGNYPQQRCLACTIRANDAHCLTGTNFNAHPE